MVLWWVQLFVAAFALGLAYWLGGLRRATPALEPKAFGLPEARAALGFVRTGGEARAVKAVVVGVLGYQDKVVEDAEVETGRLLQIEAKNVGKIENHREEIQELEESIKNLESENEGLVAERHDLGSLKFLFS